MDVTAKELERFDAVCSAFQTGVEGQLEMSLIEQYLVEAHKQNEVLQLNKQNLEDLVKSHASFPFSGPTSLTSDSFRRSAIILTGRCDSNFKQAVSIGGNYVIRARTPSARLSFIFSSLAHPPNGAPTRDDVLDVLCRVRYPTRTAAKGQLLRKPVEQLLPLAERLESPNQRSLSEKLSSSTMEQLEQLVGAFPSSDKHVVADTNVEICDGVNAEQFVKWALQVSI